MRHTRMFHQMKISGFTSTSYSTLRAVRQMNLWTWITLPIYRCQNDPITEIEVIEAAESCKESKSFIGVTPAIFKCLPPTWILFITHVLNLVFCSDSYKFPLKWCYNKLIVLFKKGVRLNCGNYRGISIGNIIGKLYANIVKTIDGFRPHDDFDHTDVVY